MRVLPIAKAGGMAPMHVHSLLRSGWRPAERPFVGDWPPRVYETAMLSVPAMHLCELDCDSLRGCPSTHQSAGEGP